MRKLVTAFLIFTTLCLLIFFLSSPADAQITSAAGNITAANASCTSTACVSLRLTPESATVSVTVSGTFSATLNYEQSGDGGVTWVPASIASTTTTGTSQFSVGALTNFRVRASVYSSGTAVVTIISSTAAGGAGGPAAVAGNPVSNGIYVTTNDILWFQFTGQAGLSIVHEFRIQKSDGTIYDSAAQGTGWTTTYTSSVTGGQGTGKAFPVSGWLIGAWAKIAGSGVQSCIYGQAFIISSMPAGGGTAGSVNTFNDATNGATLLFGGNASSFFGLAWTVGGGTLANPPTTGPGCPGNFNPSNPGAGADLAATQVQDFSSSVANGNHRVQLIAIHFRLVTSSSVASRIPCVLIGTSGLATTLTTVCSPSTQAASQTVDYDFISSGAGACPSALVTGTNCIVAGIPNPYYFGPTGVDSFFKTSTTGIQAADQISNIWVKTLAWQEQD